jgi:xylan 1,4-beta-xylosidase
MKDGRKLLSSLGELNPKDVFFRTHNLLNTGDGTPALKLGSTHACTEDATGKPAYSWTAGTATLRFNLPREGVCLLVLEVP